MPSWEFNCILSALYFTIQGGTHVNRLIDSRQGISITLKLMTLK